MREFIESTQLPFLATPMGKGVMPDDHPLSVGAARSHALQNADLVFLMGARLNWILHFGLPPRFNPDVRVVQIDIAAEEIGTNVPAEVALVGDAKAVTSDSSTPRSKDAPWQFARREHVADGHRRRRSRRTRSTTQAMFDDDSVPMNYYRVLQRDPRRPAARRDHRERGREHDGHRPARCCRTSCRATGSTPGSFGTMGVGLSFAIAAQAVHPDKRVVAVEGDSAFGFSGMEVEVACRYNMPITFIILNNNGIGGGPAMLDPASAADADVVRAAARATRR